MTKNGLVHLDDLHRHFKMGRETVRALAGVNLTITRGEILGITGPSGSGKSTLLYLLGGLDRPTSGHIWIAGRDLATLDEDELAAFRQETVGFVYQMFNLIPTLTAMENVEFPMLFSKTTSKQRRQRARRLLEMVGLGDRVDHKPTELSGGQQQRVAIARALVNDPAIILADEPTGNLDSHSGADVIGILKQLNQEGRTLILVSHDPSVISETNRSIHLLDGQVVRDDISVIVN